MDKLGQSRPGVLRTMPQTRFHGFQAIAFAD
jgi:hypothetical protein